MALPEFLTTETEEVILTRMLARIDDDIDKSEGSYIWDSCSSVAGELAILKADMTDFLQRGFAQTTFDEYLDARCAEKGITRNEAQKATGKVTFTGTEGTTIPSGTGVATPADRVLNISSIEFVTVGQVVIPSGGTVDANITAVVAGSGGEVLENTITVLSQSINGVASVTNAAKTEGGEDIETDESLLNRYLIKVRKPGTSGNQADYETWCGEITGVGGVKILPRWNGGGTVKAFLLGTNKKPADGAIVTAAQTEIDPTPGQGLGKAPIGASFTAVAATGVDIDITATVVLSGKTLEEVQLAFESALDAYLAELAFVELPYSPDVKYVRVGSQLLDILGVTDYSNLLINGSTGNITINASAGQVAIRGDVTLSV